MELNVPLIAICIATYKRPKGLGRLLESLQSLEIDGFSPHLIIADNDWDGSAEAVVNDFAYRLPFPVTYIVEPERGIASARNRLVAEARKIDVNYIAFTDDDVTVKADWLTQSMQQMNAQRADVIVGRQTYVFEGEIPAHIRVALEPVIMRRGDSGIPFSTANVVISMDALRQIDGPFDRNFNLTGGSDAMLAARLQALGKKVGVAEDSIVYEHMQASRANTQWLLRRGYRSGLNNTRIKLIMANRPKDLVIYGIKSLGYFGVSLLRLLTSLLFDRETRVIWMRQLASAIGRFHNLLNPKAVYEEYRTTFGE